MLLMEERREKIMAKLVAQGAVHVSALAQEFGVTTETIRKDLAALEEQGLLVKTHGGATLKANAPELSFGVRQQENGQQKQSIGVGAAALVPSGRSVIICTGSTTLELARQLALRDDLKVFTDSLPVAMTLMQSGNQVFLFGGELREQSSSVCGGWAISQIRQIEADMCFMGTDGFQNVSGPSSPSSQDAFVDREIIEHSEKRYVLADHTKFHRKSLYKICDWGDITALLTDTGVGAEDVSRLEAQTRVICC